MLFEEDQYRIDELKEGARRIIRVNYIAECTQIPVTISSNIEQKENDNA